jgi:hypothetical protein
MSLVSVFGESFAAQLLAVFVRGYKLCNSRESFSKRRNFIAEVNEQVTGFNIAIATTDSDWRVLLIARFRNPVVWHETTIAERPEEFVKALRTGSVAGMDVNRILEPIGFLRQPACEGLTRWQAGLFEKIKVDSGH